MKPLFCNYFLTLKCELACDFCPYWRQYDNYPEEAPLEITLKNLEILGESGVRFLNFCGGDSLLYSDLDRVLKKAQSLKMKVGLATSGLYYPQIADKIRHFCDGLFFEVGGHNQETATNAAGFDYFSKITESIRQAKNFGERVFIKFVLDRDKVLYLQETVELASSLKVPLLLWPACRTTEASDFQKETFSYIRRYQNHPAVFLNWALFEFQKKIQNKRNLQNKICRAGQYVLTILPNGRLVYPCFYRPVYQVQLDTPENYQHFLAGYPKKEISHSIPECLVCRDWHYLEPSFFYGLNRYSWFNIISGSRFYLKKTFSPYWR